MKNIASDLQMLQSQEAEFEKAHKSDTDEQLIAYLMKCSKEFGRCPKKEHIVGHTYLKEKAWSLASYLGTGRFKRKKPKENSKRAENELD